MEDTPLETTSQYAPVQKRKMNKRFIYLIAAVVLLLVLLVGYRLLGSNSTNNTSNLTPTPTEFLIPTDTPTPEITQVPSPTDTPTPSPKPTIGPTSNPVDSTTGLDRSDLTVSVQNGSGEAGVAKDGGDFLTNLGYDVTSTTNADNSDYTGVTIQVKSSASKYLALLKKDLGAKYTVGNTSSDLSASVSADALVIIGK